MDTENLMTVRDVAQRLAVTEVTIRRWLKRGILTGLETPAGWRFMESDIQTFLNQHRTPTKQDGKESPQSTEQG